MDSIIYNHQSLIFCSLMVTYFQKCLIVIFIGEPVTLLAAYSCVLSSLSMIFTLSNNYILSYFSLNVMYHLK